MGGKGGKSPCLLCVWISPLPTPPCMSRRPGPAWLHCPGPLFGGWVTRAVPVTAGCMSCAPTCAVEPLLRAHTQCLALQCVWGRVRGVWVCFHEMRTLASWQRCSRTHCTRPLPCTQPHSTDNRLGVLYQHWRTLFVLLAGHSLHARGCWQTFVRIAGAVDTYC